MFLTGQKDKRKDIDLQTQELFVIPMGGKMTESELQKHLTDIDNLTQFEMARLWRFAPSDHIYFDSTLPLYQHFNERFKALGGMTSGISKKLGWE